MAAVNIPFPSTESILGPEIARAASPPKITVKPPTKKKPGPKKHPVQAKSLHGIAKPKQTKSRNGCHTCKDKRLKCDETKPKCNQCQKRNVTCRGYKKVFQWRPEEKATFRTGPSTKGKKRLLATTDDVPLPTSTETPNRPEQALTYPTASSIPFQAQATGPMNGAPLDQQENAVANCQSEMVTDSLVPDNQDAQYCEVDDNQEEGEDNYETHEPESATTDKSVFSFDGTPTFDDTINDMSSFGITNDWQNPGGFSYQDYDIPNSFIIEADDNQGEVNEERAITPQCPVAYPSPSPSTSFPSPTRSTMSIMAREPIFNLFGTEMLIARFACETCGILSIKDGLDENPWRTMLYPMSRGVPALHHAILCLAAFHASRQDRRFRITGLQHMGKSIRYLSDQLHTMRRDAALATTLVLAFSECWNEETSSGIQHLRPARTLVTQAITNLKSNADFEEMERLRFLRNTWVYMDVIARITALDSDDLENLDALFAPVYGPDSKSEELDPLMGCASGLFPLLGNVANLVREVRRTAGSSPRVVSMAATLKVDLLRWRAPTDLQKPQDDSIEVAHTRSTAEAYRWSALLFLYQAVPMIATESPEAIAERILFDLVSVPLTSRVTVIQIFPLLVAGCELVDPDNRLLVKERWESMIHRMTIGNLDRCSDVVHEVWARRDRIARIAKDREARVILHDGGADELPHPTGRGSAFSLIAPHSNTVRPDQLYRQFSGPLFDIDKSMTVRGHAHWLTVMDDWKWAVLLG